MPLPPIQIRVHQGVHVVRDDLFLYGSKARFLRRYFKHLEHDEVVYGSSPRWGLAQVSLAYLGKRYNKKVTLFIAKSKELSKYSKRAKDLGASIIQVGTGFMAVCESRAREYVKETGALLLPCGLDIPEAIEGVEREARKLDIQPEEVWSVVSSGVLSRGLQKAWPDAIFYGVQTGKEVSKEKAGRAKVIKCDLAFNKATTRLPPFSSIPEYDAKVWEHIPKDGKKVRLFWNVGA